MHIVIVDDDPALLDALSEALVLRYGDVDVTGKTSGAEALEFLQRQPVDLVLCDVFMSGMGGCDFATALHRLVGAPPLILMTGAVGNDTPPAGIASFVLRKPFSMNELDVAMRSVMDPSLMENQ
jgi:CheY-like chemotaxis protein